VASHCVVHGLSLTSLGAIGSNVSTPIQIGEMPVFMTFRAFCVCAVNVFILISGYFGIRLTGNKVMYLIFQILFYSVLSATVYYFLVDHKITTIIKGFMIFSHSRYWFMKDYLLLMFFAPLLNNFFRDYSNRETGGFILVLLFVSCYLGFGFGDNTNVNGYTFFQFIMMYCIGRFIRINKVELSWSKSVSLYIALSLIAGFAMYFLYLHGYEKAAWKIGNYHDPLIICSAISLFLVFLSINFSNSWINKCSASALSIYLVQSSGVVEHFLYPFIKDIYVGNNSIHFFGGGKILIPIIIISLVIASISILIDQLPQRIYKMLSNKVSH
jgi:hypothetical protein